MARPEVPRATDVDSAVAALAAHGCAVIEGAAAPSLLDRLRAEIEPYVEATATGPDDFAGRRTRRTGRLVERSPAFRELALDPLVNGVVGEVLREHATNYQLHLTQVIDIGPGEPAQPIHRDQWAFDFFPFPDGWQVECHVMWALTDFTDDNGATRVIPGSHRWADNLRPAPEDTVAAEMPAGSVLLYVGSLYHGGGANRSDANRTGVNVGYTVGWLRQEENQYLACSPEIARELPVELLRLMGYARGAYALGYVGELRDPIESLGITGARGLRAPSGFRADA